MTLKTSLRRHGAFAVACLTALALLGSAYANHFANAFQFDSFHVIENNLAIRSLSNIPRFFVDADTFSVLPQNATYRPLLSTSYALDYWLAGGLDPRVFHRTQFALLLLLGGLLVALYERLFDLGERSPRNRYLALFAATLFCIHTANTETVNYITSRSSLLATLGVVGALLVYMAWPTGRRTHLYLLPMVLGALAKPLALMFAPILFVFVLLFEQRGSFRDLLSGDWSASAAALRCSAPAFVVGALLFFFLSSMDSETAVMADARPLEYLRSQPFVWLHYLRLFALPMGLTADTDWTLLPHWYDTRLFAGLLGIGGLLGAAYWASLSTRLRPAAFGLAWFALALLPTSSVIPLSELYNEHRIFFPYVGLTLAFVWLAALAALRLLRTWRTRAVGPALTALALALLVLHEFGTHRRNTVWRNPETLWADVVAKSPGNPRGFMNYGRALMGRGDYDAALRNFEQAKLLLPSYPSLEVNLGVLKSAVGDDAAAEAHFRRALALADGYAEGHFYFARWLADQERGPEAVARLERAIAISPGALNVRDLLTRLYAALGDADALARTVAETLELTPADVVAVAYSRGGVPYAPPDASAPAYADLGWENIQAERWLEAAGLYRGSLALDAASSLSWNNLGWALGSLGFYAEAVACYDAALELDSSFARARANRSWTLERAE
jgi:tetratricopeptide (TPR) repeat protein